MTGKRFKVLRLEAGTKTKCPGQIFGSLAEAERELLAREKGKTPNSWTVVTKDWYRTDITSFFLYEDPEPEFNAWGEVAP